MKLINNPDRSQWAEILKRPVMNTENLFDTVREIIDRVKSDGDRAVLEMEAKFDKAELTSLAVTEAELKEAETLVDEKLKAAIRLAKQNIETFHAAQRFEGKKVETMPGVTCWQKAVAIEKVGLYIPGGTAPLFSTVLMLAVPAKIAGCKEIVLCTPPDKEGRVHPAILFAAQVAGVNRIFKAGGVQAIASMAYGTESVPKVYKIFGPGNQYVTAAKQLVSLRDVAIDMPAGPSEVLVIADSGATPDFVASDLLSQAEHDALASAICITDNEALAHAVIAELERQSATLPRADIVRKSLADWSAVVLVPDMDAAIALANRVAPEHLEVLMREPWSVLPRIRHAGAVFLGPYAPEPLGDYFAGPNHVLPTLGTARFSSALSVQTFCKRTSIIAASPAFAAANADAVARLARMEQLEAHARSMECRKQ